MPSCWVCGRWGAEAPGYEDRFVVCFMEVMGHHQNVVLASGNLTSDKIV